MIKTCFIASAGFGTRMGNLGNIIPKPLWPFFNLRLLDLQVAYAKMLGCNKIYINSHHCHDEMLVWAKDKDVVLLHEPDILGSGGCIHNLKKHIDDEVIFIINSDQFYFFDFEQIQNDVERMLSANAIAHLYAIEVDKDASYNETKVIDGKLTSISPHDADSNYLTYSGVGILDLRKIPLVEGESSFFKTVADYNNKTVHMSLPKNPVFLDLGTLDKYIDVISDLEKLPAVVKKFVASIEELEGTDFRSTSIMDWLGVRFDFDSRIITYKEKDYSF
ncbi:sugar phosphate nucleotidyltransferase [Halobacteriovorax sp. XZX-3]|uniref:sugar phosphate nucleotidyltransferase n=1 Tax=unclassified Halobacteriovorax TaxID=2639665 RepID=UPI003715FC64